MKAVFLLLALLSFALAQEDEAVALAAAHPALAELLASHGGWRAAAYNTGNAYGVWRVQFYFPSGEELGWADVSPRTRQVYAWEASYALQGDLYRRAERALYRFVRHSPQIRALVGDSAPLEKWFWYDSWREGWFVHLERGPDSLDVSIRSRDRGSLKLSELFIEKIYFPNVLSYADLQAGRRANAVALAFAEPEIASALRAKPGWRGDGEAVGAIWHVRFFWDGKRVASAEVDLSAQRVRAYEIAP